MADAWVINASPIILLAKVGLIDLFLTSRQMGVVAIGTAGVLLRLKAAGLIERVKPHLAEIRRVGGHISDELVSEILLRAGEGPPPNPPQR